MRGIVGSIVLALTLTSAVLAAPQQVDHDFKLRGYYVLDFYPHWAWSDNSPWYILNKAPWADPALIGYGYVAVSHDGKHYYCLIQDEPMTGTRIGKHTYICGDPAIAETLYTMNWRPEILTFGSPH